MELRKPKKDVVELYAEAMLDHAAGDIILWSVINRAILGRWSKSGLVDVKRAAHKLLKK